MGSKGCGQVHVRLRQNLSKGTTINMKENLIPAKCSELFYMKGFHIQLAIIRLQIQSLSAGISRKFYEVFTVPGLEQLEFRQLPSKIIRCEL